LYSNASLDVVKVLMKSYPDAVRVRDENGELPLHIACQEAPLDVIEALVDAYPEGIKIENEFGEFPLSRAMNHPASLDAIKLLVNAFPECVQFTRMHGGLPLRDALLFSNDASLEIIKFLVDADLEGVRVANVSLDVINFLLDTYPQGVLVANKYGQLPFHVAVHRKKLPGGTEFSCSMSPKRFRSKGQSR